MTSQLDLDRARPSPCRKDFLIHREKHSNSSYMIISFLTLTPRITDVDGTVWNNDEPQLKLRNSSAKQALLSLCSIDGPGSEELRGCGGGRYGANIKRKEGEEVNANAATPTITKGGLRGIDRLVETAGS
ncbi:Hypothetical predicted protein, partial [Xyrichtys novacula]